MSYTAERIEAAFSRMHGYSRSFPKPCWCGGKVRLVGVGLSGSQYVCTHRCTSPWPAPSTAEETP